MTSSYFIRYAFYRTMFSSAWSAVGVFLIAHLCHGVTVTVDRHNKNLSIVPQDAIVNVTNFILTNNRITHVDFNSFENYTLLFLISLSDNPLKTIANGTFDNNDALSVIYCTRCAIESAPASFGPCTGRMGIIEFSQGIVNRDVLINFDFMEFKQLTSLSLELVALTDLNVLRLPASIRTLIIIEVELSMLPQVHHTKFPELFWLDLKRNKLSLEIPYSWFEGLSINIFYIDLAMNGVVKLPEVLAIKPHLQFLSLEKNRLRTIPDMLAFPMLRVLLIRGNPVTCDQKMCWWRLWERKQAPLSKDDVQCQMPPFLKGFMLSNVNPKVMGCHNGKWPIDEGWACWWQWCVFVFFLLVCIMMRDGLRSNQNVRPLRKWIALCWSYLW